MTKDLFKVEELPDSWALLERTISGDDWCLIKTFESKSQALVYKEAMEKLNNI